MEILDFIKEYWVIITFFIGEVGIFLAFVKNINESTKCTLRNDIVDIYDRCKDQKKITHYQLQSMRHSYDRYKKLHGNSFADDLMERVQYFELID